MNLLLGFAPFILFSVLAGSRGPAVGLWAAAAAAAALVLRGRRGGGSIKLLDAGALVLLVALGAFVSFVRPDLPEFWARLWVNSALAAIAVGSILLRRPFTLQYAREQVPQAQWAHPLFLRVNYRISAVWAAAFVVQALVAGAVAVVPALPEAVRFAVSAAALADAVLFTIEYPRRVRARARAA